MISFDTAFDRVLGHEGGYTNDPEDPGKETNWGISKRAYPELNIKELSKQTAKEIYFRDYWRPLMNLGLNDNVRFHIFDYAVNSGVNQAVKSYLKVYLKGESDLQQIVLLTAERIHFLSSLPSWSRFGRGWTERIVKNLNFAVTDVE